MGQPYVGEIRIFAGNFNPNGWMFCDGTQLPISGNETLFQLIGTTYGGDGQQTFALPDLRGRVPIHQGTDPNGNSYAIGRNGGVETVGLTPQQLPAHNHPLLATNANSTLSPLNASLGVVNSSQTGANIYNTNAPNTSLNPAGFGNAGSGLAHENRQPFLCLNFIISLFGIYPSPT